MSAARAFFVRNAKHMNAFDSTVHTVGPWSPKLQHGSPTSALLTRSIEQMAARFDGQAVVSRVSVLFFKPVPVATIHIKTDSLRRGNKAAHLSASVFDENGSELVRAIGLCVKRPAAPLTLPDPPAGERRVVPVRAATGRPAFAAGSFPYMDAIDLQVAEGTPARGGTAVWTRPLVQLIDGEEASPLQRMMMFVDSAGGMSYYVDMAATSFVNADMTVNVLRPPATEWILTRSRVDLNAAHGTGTVAADVFDEDGLVAHVTQNQIIESRL
jgi:hypothetical protein